ncbi:MAG: galactose-1-phosphate uridylyltransferase [Actinomycetota bacterium]
MSQLRLNPLTGRWVTTAVNRGERPIAFVPRQLPVEAAGTRPCPFCPGNEEATPPALETYGPNGEWSVRVVPNLYPAFEGDAPMTVTHLGPVFTQANASGIHEVLVYSPDLRASWGDLDDKQAGLVMAAIRDRVEDHARTSGIRYTQAIVNHGREAGASLEHPHGQLLGIPFVPGEIAEEESGFRRFQGSCLLCTTAESELRAQHRVVVDTEGVVAVCPFWSGSPFVMLLIPKRHEVHMQDATPSDVVAVGRALRDAIAMLRNVVGDIAPYNIVFHTAPHHHRGDFHWHVHLLPKLATVAGFELGTGVMINVVPPELATQQLLAGQ